MSYALFISRNDIIKQTPLQGSIDADRLLTFVRTAQDKYMLNLLGTVLFYYLQAQIEAGTIDQLPVAYQDLLNDHIKPTLIWYSVAEYLPFSNTQFKSEGAVRHKSDQSETVDKNQIDYLLQKALNSADFYATRTQNYLISYSDRIPQYLQSIGNQTQVFPDMGNAYFGGINL
jgi:hypothetical protein